MTIEYAVAQIMSRLTDWAGLPKYQLERRVDIFLTPFLEPFIGGELGPSVKLVAPEFPVLSELLEAGSGADREQLSALTVNMDYLLWVAAPQPYWLLLELKTEETSFKPSQADIYAVARERGMPKLISDLKKVRKATAARHRWKYDRLLQRLPPPEQAGQPIKVNYLGPRALADRVTSRLFPGETADRKVHPQEPAKVVDRFHSLQDFASMPLAAAPEDVRALWPYVRDLLRAIDLASGVRAVK